MVRTGTFPKPKYSRKFEISQVLTIVHKFCTAKNLINVKFDFFLNTKFFFKWIFFGRKLLVGQCYIAGKHTYNMSLWKNFEICFPTNMKFQTIYTFRRFFMSFIIIHLILNN